MTKVSTVIRPDERLMWVTIEGTSPLVMCKTGRIGTWPAALNFRVVHVEHESRMKVSIVGTTNLIQNRFLTEV